MNRAIINTPLSQLNMTKNISSKRRFYSLFRPKIYSINYFTGALFTVFFATNLMAVDIQQEEEKISCFARIKNWWQGLESEVSSPNEAPACEIDMNYWPEELPPPESFAELPDVIEEAGNDEGFWKKAAADCGSFPQKLKNGKDWVFRKVSTPAGTTFLAVVYSAAQGVTNLGWALNWTRLGVDEVAAPQISEAFGITTAGLCFLFGVAVPMVVYIWVKRHPDENPAVPSPENA